jgi:hypothetical protein
MAASYKAQGASATQAYNAMMSDSNVQWSNYSASDVEAALTAAGYDLSALVMTASSGAIAANSLTTWLMIGLGVAALGYTVYYFSKKR